MVETEAETGGNCTGAGADKQCEDGKDRQVSEWSRRIGQRGGGHDGGLHGRRNRRGADRSSIFSAAVDRVMPAPHLSTVSATPWLGTVACRLPG